MKSFIDELEKRGLIQDMVPGTKELLEKKQVSAYVGFDPTADSLHVGHLVQVMLLVHLQRSGHKPIALVGGATGMVGDPSGKSQERNLLTEEAVRHNAACIEGQLKKFLDFDGKDGATLVNNLDWIGPMSFIDFIRDVGKHIPVGYMLAKESVKKRMDTGLSFTEFTYQLLQGYDFYHLYAHLGCELQMGGSDQWGNMTTGTEFIRRKAGGEAFAIISPLLTKADGTKFGKTESGAVWLDPKKTSPYDFYQFWLRASDQDAVRYVHIFSLAEVEDIQALIKAHEQEPHKLELQRFLARELTERVHGAEALRLAELTSELLFGKGTTEQLQQLSENEIREVFQGVPVHEISDQAFRSATSLVDLLAEEAPVFPSKGEARRKIKSGALAVNKQKITEEVAPSSLALLQNRYLLVQNGKKNYHLIVVS